MVLIVPMFAVALAVAPAAPQDAPQEPTVQQLFEAGQYQPLLDRVSQEEAPSPADLYLAGLSARKLPAPPENEPDQPDTREEQARTWFGKLGSEGEDAEQDPWTFVRRSALAVGEHNADEAVAAARQAVDLAPDNVYAQFQLGLAYGEAKDMTNAAKAFDHAIAADPKFAYAYYYAGNAYYRIKRTDKMVNLFEKFVKLAPDAPERPAIVALLRTVRRH
jgi:tetratricopeptide (TPR) repeat protein